MWKRGFGFFFMTYYGFMCTEENAWAFPFSWMQINHALLVIVLGLKHTYMKSGINDKQANLHPQVGIIIFGIKVQWLFITLKRWVKWSILYLFAYSDWSPQHFLANRMFKEDGLKLKVYPGVHTVLFAIENRRHHANLVNDHQKLTRSIFWCLKAPLRYRTSLGPKAS